MCAESRRASPCFVVTHGDRAPHSRRGRRGVRVDGGGVGLGGAGGGLPAAQLPAPDHIPHRATQIQVCSSALISPSDKHFEVNRLFYNPPFWGVKKQKPW